MKKRMILFDTEPGDFFVVNNNLHLASEDMDKSIRVKDGEICLFMNYRKVEVVTGHDLRKRL